MAPPEPPGTATPAEPAPSPGPTATPPAEPPPAVVLHAGDSMVGTYGGLARALGPRFRALGTKYVDDSQPGIGIAAFDVNGRFAKLLAANEPDLVLVTLGANDAAIPSPWVLAKHVASIARRAAGPDGKRRCIWMGPPMWKKDTGVLDVIANNAAPCAFFDARALSVQRRRDGIHPSDEGGEQWAAAFWAFYRPHALISP